MQRIGRQAWSDFLRPMVEWVRCERNPAGICQLNPQFETISGWHHWIDDTGSGCRRYQRRRKATR